MSDGSSGSFVSMESGIRGVFCDTFSLSENTRNRVAEDRSTSREAAGTVVRMLSINESLVMLDRVAGRKKMMAESVRGYSPLLD